MPKPVALITGASRGIGRAAAVALASAGYRLALVARGAADLTLAARATGLPATDLLEIPADVSQAADCDRAVAACIARFGQLNAIVHAAGIAPVSSIEETTPEIWHRTIDTNLSAAFYLMKYGWKWLRGQARPDATLGGAIVLISSLASRDPFPGFGAYAAAKAGINLLGLMAAREGQPDQIRVHTLAPGAVETGMFRAIATQAQWPTEKTLSPDDVARIILDCITGPLAPTAGEVLWLHKTL